jgi:hypothetical protein
MTRQENSARWQISTASLDIGVPKMNFLDRFMQNWQRNKHLERLIVQSYVWVLGAPRTIDGQKVASLSRHGFYEVRLLEPSELVQYNDLPFWVELFDNKRSLCIDSYAGDDIEETAGAVQHLISRAELLDQGSDI